MATEHRIVLTPEDDRVVSVNITDKNGTTYLVTLEVGSQHDLDDEIQVNVYKRKRDPLTGVRSPNAVFVQDGPIEQEGASTRFMSNGVWFEFHALEHLHLKPVTDL